MKLPLILDTCVAIITTILIIITVFVVSLIFSFLYCSILEFEYPMPFSDVILQLSLIDITIGVIVCSKTFSIIIYPVSFILDSVFIIPDSLSMFCIELFSLILCTIRQLDLSFSFNPIILKLSLISASISPC